jgi:hypothetical protein
VHKISHEVNGSPTFYPRLSSSLLHTLYGTYGYMLVGYCKVKYSYLISRSLDVTSLRNPVFLKHVNLECYPP